jgi:hypothetical protein
VTGSAHCALGPHWRAKLSRANFLARQSSARGGVVKVGVCGDRVQLGGQAVTGEAGDRGRGQAICFEPLLRTGLPEAQKLSQH